MHRSLVFLSITASYSHTNLAAWTLRAGVEAAEKIVKAEKIGDTDLLTGLPNRRAILKRLKQEARQ